MHVCMTADLGLSYIGWVATTTDGSVICVLTPRVCEDAGTRASAAELLLRHGVSAVGCGHECCPVSD